MTGRVKRMEPIDAGLEAFRRLRPEIVDYVSTVVSEEDTRLKVIDRILTDVLFWPHDSISTEVHAASGYADYALRVQGRVRLVLEAKRDGRALGVQGRDPGRPYKLSGGVFTSEAAKEGIDQGIRYCAELSSELACVTNGREWVVFRGTRLGDGLPTRDGVAFVFPSLEAVEANFKLFFSLLSFDSVSRFGFRPFFQEAEGQPIRMSVFHKSVRPKGSARFLPTQELYADVDRVMTTYFQRLLGEGNEEMLEACFVESSESQAAQRQLVRITEDVVNRVRNLDTASGQELVNLIERTRAARQHQFVLLIGTKGAGKSTFLARFFNSVLPRTLARHVVIARVDLGTQSGDYGTLVSWLNRELIDKFEAALFGGSPDFDQQKGMFYDEYTRLKAGSWRPLYDSDYTEFQIRFGMRIEQWRTERTTDYIAGLIRYVVNSKASLPVLVLDNADHFDIPYQQRVYQYARSLYERALCVVILPITDRTSWQLSKEGALQSFENESLFLPAPRTEDVIRKRIEYLATVVKLERNAPKDSYSIAGNVSISIDDLSAFVQTLQRVFLQDSQISSWIGQLSNYDIRRTLELARQLISSPHLKVADLVSAYLAGSAVYVPEYRAVRALVRLRYDIYPTGQHNYVQNIFDLNEDLATSPLLGLRILQLLSDVPRDERRAALLNVDELVGYCAGMGIEARATYLWLEALLETGLVLNYDPTITDVMEARQVEVSPSGRLHLHWGLGNYEYISAMAIVTPLLTESVFSGLSRAAEQWSYVPIIRMFVGYLLDEDRAYCSVPDHDRYQSQRRLRSAFERLEERMASEHDGKPRKLQRPAQ
jgi:ABC-type iron transport system FetAB ATPase subunit